MNDLCGPFTLDMVEPTFGAVHASDSVEDADGGLAWFGPGALKRGPSFWQQMVLESIHDQLLTFAILLQQNIGRHVVCYELNNRRRNTSTLSRGNHSH